MTDIPAPPETIGPYRIDRELGSGGMGTVYVGTHQETGQVAAVKVLSAALAREPGLVARFEREIDALRTLSSPYIVTLYESGTDQQTCYYAMELVDGESLVDRLEREKRLPWREVIDLGIQICRALKAAHNAGVIHRDLKPSNLMLTSDGQIKLADFGVAQVFAGNRLTATGGIIGTAEYMSPEQAQGKRATKQSDLYSLGAVLYAMLTGRPPFRGRSQVEIAHQHQYGRFDSPRCFVPEIPRWLDELVCHCLEKQPENRPPDAYVLERRLAEIPKKVDLAASEDRPSQVDLSADTVATGNPAVADIGGTFVRDLMRADLEREKEDRFIGNLFDNLWVLVSLLILLVAVTIWMFRTRAPDPQELYDSGVALMNSDNRADWLKADREMFQPLRELDSELWSSRIAEYEPRIALARVERELKQLSRRVSAPDAESSEPLRVLERAAAELRRGEVERARAKLTALGTLLASSDNHEAERRVLLEILEQLPPPAPRSPGPEDAAMERAQRLADSGRITEARKIWSAIIMLYSEDPLRTNLVEQARTRLSQSADSSQPEH